MKEITDNADKLKYISRMTKTYCKKGEDKCFLFQYLEGDGNEIRSHFWSDKSSSRFAFELYSWIAYDNKFTDFEFEKKLPGINTVNENKLCKGPNMDVYIETESMSIFIESKYKEIYKQQVEKLSGAYYLEKGEAKNTRGGEIKSTLAQRFYFDKDASEAFSKFIKQTIKDLEDKNYKKTWMDFKQEITHLFGIYFEVCLHQELYKNKDIVFLNVYYDHKLEMNDGIYKFFIDAQVMMSRLLINKCKSFTYEYISAQDLVKNNEYISFDENALNFLNN